MFETSPVWRDVACDGNSTVRNARRMRVGRELPDGGGGKPKSHSERVEALCGGVCATLARGSRKDTKATQGTIPLASLFAFSAAVARRRMAGASGKRIEAFGLVRRATGRQIETFDWGCRAAGKQIEQSFGAAVWRGSKSKRSIGSAVRRGGKPNSRLGPPCGGEANQSVRLGSPCGGEANLAAFR